MKRRVNYLIDKKFQLAFAAKFALLSTFFSAFIGLQFYATVWPAVSEFIPAEILALIENQIFLRGILFLSLAAILIIVISIIISHRVAGPIASMKGTLDRIGQGEDIELIRLRKNDELKDLAEKINGVISMIKELKESPSRGGNSIGVKP